MTAAISIGGREIGPGRPAYLVAEMSANHGQSLEQALNIISAAHDAGADAIKLQTYTPDTLTIDVDNEHFQIKDTLWSGRTLYSLYAEAYTPWDWHPQLKQQANQLGLDFFSSPFDETAVDFLEEIGVPAYKIASFEIVDLPLLRRVAETGKPIILSTGMASLAEIAEAVQTIREAGGQQIVLLHCNSAYPAPPEDMNLRTIPHLAAAFDVPVGLSDHTLGSATAVAAVALGACLVEKHFTLSRAIPGPDSAFSLEPAEFKGLVDGVRDAEKSLGGIHYGATHQEAPSLVFRRSLFVVQDLQPGDLFTTANVRSIRPGSGLHTRYLPEVLKRRAARAIKRGTPMSWDIIA